MPETSDVDQEENAFLDGNSIKNEEGHTDIAVEPSETKENMQTERSSFREYGSKRFKARGSLRSSGSLELRRLRPHFMLQDDVKTMLQSLAEETSKKDFESDAAEIKTNDAKRQRFDLLRMTCLKPTYSLRKQIILAFGTPTVLTILLIMAASIIFTVYTTKSITSDARSD
eukprot:1246357-Ditylum_brightwellii.AAC.1